ncbi:MAG: hypothetical protein CMI96_03365 [Pelagibacteraceae bacterium]|nr:hypothetical protein [Pelagibacteraceae bacterium]|tara:strand:+ start:10703 stop:11233 length:531 start_codon:yes stop_codon:yes gene_type:complete
MKRIIVFILLSNILIISCNSVRESAGVNRKSIDEYQVIENPPLVIPPNFNLLPPDQIKEKNIKNIESDLAKEILFGLDENTETDSNNKSISVMDDILKKVDSKSTNSSIRSQIDEEFSNIKTLSDQENWLNNDEIVDAINESNNLRNKKMENAGLLDNDSNNKSKKVKKKKRFFFF